MSNFVDSNIDQMLNEDVAEVREYWGTDEDGDDWRIHVYSSR